MWFVRKCAQELNLQDSGLNQLKQD
jgi:hypothetical protein